MRSWLLDDPAGISLLTVVAAALVAGAAWAAGALGLAVLAAAVRIVRRRARPRGTDDS